MGPVGWIVVVALVYIALAKSLVLLIHSLRNREWDWPVLLVMASAANASLTPIMVRLYQYPRKDMGRTYTYVHRPLDAAGVALIVAEFCIVLIVVTAVSNFARARARKNDSTWQDRKRQRELSRQIKLHLALVTGAIIFSVPFYWLVTTSLKPDERTNMMPPDLIPVKQRRVTISGAERMVYDTVFDDKPARAAKMNELEGGNWEVRILGSGTATRILPAASMKASTYPVALWSNYTDALKFLPPEYRSGLTPLWNTVYVTLLTIIGTVLSSSLVAFAFARLRWPGRDLLFVIMLATMMIPGAVTMLPVFLIYRSLGWIDTLKPLWFGAFFGSGFNVFLLRQFFMTIPNELEDAAKIDGCSYFTIYWKIMLPLIKPALAALTIFAFMGSWNNFMGPLIYLSSPEKMTLAYALQLFQGAHGGEPAMMMAAATLVMLPVLVVFFFTQRYMIQGVTLTGIKG